MNTYSEQNLDEVDQALGRFFKAQVPDPWPACRALQSTTLPRRRSPWLAAMPRLALAASLVLFFFGYFLLAGVFPKPDQPGLRGDPGFDMSHNPKLDTTTHPKSAPMRP